MHGGILLYTGGLAMWEDPAIHGGFCSAGKGLRMQGSPAGGRRG